MAISTTALFNGAALESARHAEAHRKNASEATLQLASGHKQVSASKDSSTQAIVAKLISTGKVLEQAKINAKNAASVIQVATGALKNIQDLLSSMDALTAKANSADSDSATKSLMNSEYTQLRDQITDIANRTRWNGVSLLGGAASSVSYGAAAAVTATSSNVIAVNNAWAANATAMTGFVSGVFQSVSVSTTTGAA